MYSASKGKNQAGAFVNRHAIETLVPGPIPARSGYNMVRRSKGVIAMLARALLTIAVTLLASGLSGEEADVGPCPLDFDFTLSSAARGDSVLVVFI